LRNADWKWLCGFLLFTLACMIIWERVGYVRFSRWSGSPLGALSVGYELLTHSEIYTDIKVSLLELFGGIVLGGSIALFVVTLMSASRLIRSALILLLPLSNISLMVLWLLSFLILGRIVPNFLFWHKVIGVACLVFFPFV
jgi:ABC-type nitrate/sulfonate/bicarbonate transport system permease component